MNKKGDIPSLIYIVVIIFVIALIFLFTNHLKDRLYTSLDTYFNSTPTYNESEARTALTTIHTGDNSGMWDYAFLFIAVGMLLVMALTAYSTRISPLFYWIYGVLTMIILMIGVVLSNFWQSIASNSVFSTTITRFPITNLLLGTYYPTMVTAVIIIAIVLLFGKPGGSQFG
jgi:chromate transport protein ChrA